nr:uncharacterized protein CTRU02_04895 [Colletotrichum truncatum]KAF6794694.1 hypothetical protein CTRU02_04895 [Colletotrichum truncatum]
MRVSQYSISTPLLVFSPGLVYRATFLLSSSHNSHLCDTTKLRRPATHTFNRHHTAPTQSNTNLRGFLSALSHHRRENGPFIIAAGDDDIAAVARIAHFPRLKCTNPASCLKPPLSASNLKHPTTDPGLPEQYPLSHSTAASLALSPPNNSAPRLDLAPMRRALEKPSVDHL